MKKITLILITILSLQVGDAIAQQSYLHIINKSNQDITVLPAITDPMCYSLPIGSYVVPAGQDLTHSFPSSSVAMVRLYPISCFTPVASVTLGSPCSNCPNGGLPSLGTFTDAPCGGNTTFTATWIRCFNTTNGPFQNGNLIIVQ